MLKIVKYPHPVLRKTAEAIKTITPEVTKFHQELLETLVPQEKKEPLGVGLAATQVNQLYRSFVVKLPKSYEICINPQIIKTSKKTLSSLPKKAQFLEGCLSIPGYFGFVDRPIKIKVKYLSSRGLAKQATLTPPHSSYFQHELDHLNGVLFIDYIKKSGEQLYKVNQKAQLEPVRNPFK